jgi:ParB family chromosome partitioning protein
MTNTTTTTTDDRIVRVPIELLHADPDNPRRKADGTDLVASIKAIGVQQAIHVRPPNEDGVHVIIFGHRRHDGAQKAGLTEVPVIIREMTAEDLLIAQLVENMHEDLDPVEEATGYSDSSS